MRAFINRQLSYGVKNKVTSEGALSILFNSLFTCNFNRLTTNADKVNTKGNKPLGVTTSM